jgi:hypothetical protein
MTTELVLLGTAHKSHAAAGPASIDVPSRIMF